MTRADALRNRARVVAAATEVFAERGVDAGVPEIAARAGVGKATVYRSFPTKDHLVAAILTERIEWFEERARAALDEPDAGRAFRDLLTESFERQARDQVLAGGLAPEKASPQLEAVRRRATAALDHVVARAREQGALRADARTDEVRTLLMGTSRVLHEAAVTDAGAWRRYAELVADAFAVR